MKKSVNDAVERANAADRAKAMTKVPAMRADIAKLSQPWSAEETPWSD